MSNATSFFSCEYAHYRGQNKTCLDLKLKGGRVTTQAYYTAETRWLFVSTLDPRIIIMLWSGDSASYGIVPLVKMNEDFVMGV